MAHRRINRNEVLNIFDYIAYFEHIHGDLNFFFCTVFEGIFAYNEIIELLYLYDRINGLDKEVDIDEYEARLSCVSMELHFDKIKNICKDIHLAMQNDKYKPNFKGGHHGYKRKG